MEVGALTDSETEMIVMATYTDGAGPSVTWSSKIYLKDFSNVGSNRTTTTYEEPLTKQRSCASRGARKRIVRQLAHLYNSTCQSS